MPTEPEGVHYLGVEFHNLTYPEVAEALDGLSKGTEFAFVVTPNVDHVILLHESAEHPVAERFRQAYTAARLRLCDSRILQLLAKLQGAKLEVVTGSDLTAFLFLEGHLAGRKVALIGGDEAMAEELRRQFPDVEIAQYLPPMGVLNNERAHSVIEQFIIDVRPHYTFFAIGAPQSEIIAHRCLRGGKASGVALCIGAAIEFLIGRKTRAPKWMQMLRLEWSFRLLSEPRRLWRRYLATGPRIVAIARREKRAAASRS